MKESTVFCSNLTKHLYSGIFFLSWKYSNPYTNQFAANITFIKTPLVAGSGTKGLRKSFFRKKKSTQGSTEVASGDVEQD
jgi:hypothetical protein